MTKTTEIEIPKFKELKDKVILLKITVTDYDLHTRGMPYRIIAVTPADSLYDVAQTIVFSFNFDFDHMFGFYWPLMKRFYDAKKRFEYFVDVDNGFRNECKMDGKPVPQSVVQTDVFNVLELLKNDKMLFLFDYGDEWRFIVKLYGIEDKKARKKYPAVYEKVGRAPQQYQECF